MDPQQFGDFINALNQALAPLANIPTATTSTGGNPTTTTTAATSTPCLSVKLPVYKGEAGKNIYMWCMQLGVIFNAQGITEAITRIHYASTALEGGALHWYLNQCQVNNGAVPYTSWDLFAQAMKDAFQLPHYQQYL